MHRSNASSSAALIERTDSPVGHRLTPDGAELYDDMEARRPTR